jgi:glycosyltransferase involved in cell wall biosynthesis
LKNIYYAKDLVSIIIPTLNEEDNIGQLILSIFEQKYRPIEVVIVDGGSRDRTIAIIEDLRRKISNTTFEIKVLFERDYGSLRSQPNARNIGIKNSRGKYIVFFDADFILTDKNLISKVKEELDNHPWVGVKVSPIIDSWIEKHLAISDYNPTYGGNIHKYCAVRREVFNRGMFNPILGFREDIYFFEHIGVNVKVIDAFVSRHFPHTLSEYKKQQIWYGRTVWLYLKTFYSPKNILELVLVPVIPLGLLFFGVIFLFVQWIVSLLLIIAFTGIIVRAFAKSPERSLSRLAFILFSRILGGTFYAYGLIKGFYSNILKHQIKSSRE